MISNAKHQKHPSLVRSSIGAYHRCEWAIYGTTCDTVLSTVRELRSILSDLNISYVDADHGEKNESTKLEVGKKQFQTNKIQDWNHFDDRLQSQSSDLTLINGNHYPASRQIVIIDQKKKSSLERRKDQLTRIDLVLVPNDVSEIFDFVKERMKEQTKVVLQSDREAIGQFIRSEYLKCQAPLKALILAGGKSQRMGQDKSQIVYHNGKSQEEHLFDLLQSKKLQTYISKKYNDSSSERVILDKLVDMGPFGAIVSAMMTDPNAAWLVVACDLPFLDDELLGRLIDCRNTQKVATAFRGVDNPFPEPLITIYEPRAYQRFLSFLSLGYACPRKVLINSDVEEVLIEDMQYIINANTKEEMNSALLKLQK